MNSWSSGSWKTSPTRARSAGSVSGPTASPATSSSPAPRRRPLRWSISVVLPAPLGPSTATRSPWATVRSRPRSTSRARRVPERQPARLDRAAHAATASARRHAREDGGERAVGAGQRRARRARRDAGPAARGHRDVDALAARVGAQEQRGRQPPGRGAVEQVAGAVAARGERGPHPPDLGGDDEHVAPRDGRRSRRAAPARAGAAGRRAPRAPSWWRRAGSR